MKKIITIIFIFLVLEKNLFNYKIIIINLFFKTFFKNYVYMMNLTLYIFGARYISRGKLAPTVGGGNPKAFLKV